VLLLTTQGEASAAAKGMELGASGFLAKHVTAPKLLVQKLREVLKDRA
jgi:DNA-binding NarL/FixJ family response regulator